MAEGDVRDGGGGLETELSDLRVEDGAALGDMDYESGEECENEDVLVGLGFVQAVEQPWKISRHHFPSKVGGTPAWLDPVHLPEGDRIRCGICGNPLGFLLQVYAPIDGNKEAFHRSLFVFVCPNMACLQQDQHHQCKLPSAKPCRSVRVFRSQLPRSNPFYSYDPPLSDGQDSPSCKGAPLCTWCGTWKAHSLCGGCKKVRYCCTGHQLDHWRAGHARFCRQVQAASDPAKEISVGNIAAMNEAVESSRESDATGICQTTSGHAKEGLIENPAVPTAAGITLAASDKLWPEMELLVDEEDNYEDVAEDGSEGPHNPVNRAEQLLDDYERRRKEGEEFSARDVQDVEEASREQQHWAAFQARLARAPDQVLRYCRSSGAKPMWPSLEGQPKSSDIPACPHCGGSQTFELQLLPQLLYFLQVQNEADSNSLDWATIVVYSCAASCDEVAVGNDTYMEEFAWVQLAVT